ncbi:helix-turn-helix domain-containing protein [Desertihabitans aurantiacus]|uniref:helix-turn-helix domain-containing protein n=1 Tax=Desertihabitans aurantiacus TaxID=2282477 RepID=UPI000DF7E51A|nr:helix-turn-helix transcriptional regulator [Desertihabitans aurantiacus]
MDTRADIRDFLTSRRARLTPELVGLPSSARRRVPGLRREEVAILAGVSTEWYTRLEKGHIAGVSEEVLHAVAEALRLDEDERTYLFDLARAARPTQRRPIRRRDVEVAAPVQWLLDSITLSAAFVRNGRLDIIATNPLARALHAPMFDSPTTAAHGRANFARYHFLDEASREFFTDWESGARVTVALLRAEAGREPHDRDLRELVGELSTLSEDFRRLWGAHDIRIRHAGTKGLRHPQVGELELVYQSVDLPAGARVVHDLSLYTAEPGTASDERLRLLASLAATPRTGIAERPRPARG